MRSLLITTCTAVLIGLSPMAASQPLAAVAIALPAPQIAYQGRLLEAALPVTGVRNFLFQILDSSSHELWNSGVLALPVNSGLYAVVLGASSMTGIPISVLNTPNLFLRVSIEGRTLIPDVDLVPAMQARSAFELSGSFAGDLGGTQYKTTLKSLLGFPLDPTTPPTSGQSLVFNGDSWVPSTVLGTPGPAGSQGPVGPLGPAGPMGPMGLSGVMGPQGAQGFQGTSGLVGPQGTVGAKGATFLSGPGEPVTAGAAGEVGDYYFDTLNGTFYGPKVGDDWVGLIEVSLVGPRGPQGDPGTVGAQGPAGATGTQGSTGTQGAVGTTGAQGPMGPIGFQGPMGPGSVVSITAGAGLTGGTITTSGTVAIQSPYIDVTTTGGLTGGGRVFLGGVLTLSDPRFGMNTSFASSGRGSDKTIGEVWLVAGNRAGGVPCAGQLLQISQNTALFSLLGTTYGGNGIQTFALPDLRGVAPSGLTYVICTQGIFPASD